jgi:hypothetical protein
MRNALCRWTLAFTLFIGRGPFDIHIGSTKQQGTMKLLLPLLIILTVVPSLYSAPCETVKSLALSNATITLAQPVAPNGFTPPQGTRGPTFSRACLHFVVSPQP